MNTKLPRSKTLGESLGPYAFSLATLQRAEPKKHRIQRIPVMTKMILLTMLGLCAYGVLLVEP